VRARARERERERILMVGGCNLHMHTQNMGALNVWALASAGPAPAGALYWGGPTGGA